MSVPKKAIAWEQARIELRREGLYLHNVPPDGWCQYAALGLLLQFTRADIHVQILNELPNSVRIQKQNLVLDNQSTWGDEATLEAYCNKTNRSIRIYGMGVNGRVTSYLFPLGSTLPELSYEGRRCGLWLSGSHYQAVLPDPPEPHLNCSDDQLTKLLCAYQQSSEKDAMETLSSVYYHLTTKYPCAEGLPCCALCLSPVAKTSLLADSHRIPNALLSMIDLSWVQDNIVRKAEKTETFKLLCNAGKKPPLGSLMCEELLSARGEEGASKLFAGANWKKELGNKLHSDGWLCSVRDLNPGEKYHGSYGPEFHHCIASIFFRILITSEIPHSPNETEAHNKVKSTILAQLHNYIFNPDAGLSLVILLAWSWDGMSTTTINYEPELVRHVIATGEGGKYITVHFAILGWHFLLLSAETYGSFFDPLYVHEVLPRGGNFEVSFENRTLPRGPNWIGLLAGYNKYIHFPTLNSSSVKSNNPNPGSTVRVSSTPANWMEVAG